MQGADVLVGYDVDKDYKVTGLFFASEIAKYACLESMEVMEADDWAGFEELLSAADATQIMKKSPANLALEAFV